MLRPTSWRQATGLPVFFLICMFLKQSVMCSLRLLDDIQGTDVCLATTLPSSVV